MNSYANLSRTANGLQAVLESFQWSGQFTLLRIEMPRSERPAWTVEFRFGPRHVRITRTSTERLLAAVLSILRQGTQPIEYQI